MVRSQTWVSRTANGVLIGFLALTALLCLAPIWHTLAVSLSDKSAAAAGIVYAWPVKFTWSSYEKLLQDSKFFDAFYVSLKRVALGGIINFALTILMAYPLSKQARQLPGRNVVTWVLVFTMLFNAGLIPWYMTISKLGMLDSIWALVLPGAVPIFNVILLLNFFRGVPKELEESAFVDGAGPWRTLLQIYIPIGLPALATVTLFSIVGHWNSFFDGLILMNHPSNYPLQTYIQQLVVQLNTQSLMTAEEARKLMEISNKTLNAAKIFVSMIPILIVYPFLQRYFIHGIVLGSVKE
ncbi:carbohydrate ABC transporter permease [Cohnella silvisoli]|uniref:Carbohydrate ABC transporter permease n=1 Tax=Cohnella silvisoli TaxID=2873699 RepID=A0ABV1L275_9BACL|nr:carbohydrate ABC transporter permease [Cohnella silvisoli]MCD9025708.1 carbohydrate ABC transporter permease [Cohnella silvisoli]